VYFFTDADDPVIQKQTGDHLVVTQCGSSHHRYAKIQKRKNSKKQKCRKEFFRIFFKRLFTF
jgi:hypothetical protein